MNRPLQAAGCFSADIPLHLFKFTILPLQVQAGEGYWLLTGWSACSRWRFLSVYPLGEACLACLQYVFVSELALQGDGAGGDKPHPYIYGLQLTAFGFDDASNMRYECVKRCCS